MKEPKYRYNDDFGSIGIRGKVIINEDHINSIVLNHELETITPNKNQLYGDSSKIRLTDFFDLKNEELKKILDSCDSYSIDGNVLTIRISE